MPNTETTEIAGGIEWFTFRRSDGTEDTDCQCARCGSSCSYVECANCGGDGEIDDMDNWEWPTIYRCDWCRGKGGSWHCLSGVEWCRDHPMQGREHIKSSAMSSEAWRDVL